MSPADESVPPTAAPADDDTHDRHTTSRVAGQWTGTPPGPSRLSAEKIVAAAVLVVDTAGVARFTMRQLGATLGVHAMSIYRYFPSRRALLDAVVEAVGCSSVADLAAQLGPDDDWRHYLDRLAHHVRGTALTHPRLFLLIASHPTAVPWLRPPIRSVYEVNAFVQRLTDDNFSSDTAAAAYKQFTAFLLGHLLGEVTAHGTVEPSRTSVDQDGPRSMSGYVRLDRTSRPSPRAGRGAEESTGVGPCPAAGAHQSATVRLGAATTPGATPDMDLAGHSHLAALVGLLAADTFAADFDRDLTLALDDLARLRER